jgi:hypothetical protein
MKIFTRNELFRMFLAENNASIRIGQMIFKSISDENLANMFGLTLLRKGYFVSK